MVCDICGYVLQDGVCVYQEMDETENVDHLTGIERLDD